MSLMFMNLKTYLDRYGAEENKGIIPYTTCKICPLDSVNSQRYFGGLESVSFCAVYYCVAPKECFMKLLGLISFRYFLNL
jgi:hypothetical protein